MRYRILKLLILSALIFLAAEPWEAGAESARDNPLEGNMVLVPAGHFIFGTDKKDETGEALSLGIPKPWHADETPRQQIFLKSFYLDRFEVTNRRYKIFIDDVGGVFPPEWKNNSYPEGLDDHPIIQVNWFDAVNFCNWAGKKLPTEKQWEKAARGTEGNEYPWENSFQPGKANLPDKPGSRIQPASVGSFPEGATSLGIHDLAGNVWEWVADDYAPYKGSDYKSEYFDNGLKVLRGMSSRDIGHFPGAAYQAALEQFARSGYRQFGDPDQGAPDVGFRCASENKPEAVKLASKTAAAEVGSSETKENLFSSGTTNNSSSGSTQAPPPTINPFEAKPNLPPGFLVLVFLSFVAGILSFLSPCTLPILPAYFAVTAQTDRARISLMSVAFFMGLATLFVGMGASASLAGQLLRDYLFSLTTAGGALVIVFGMMTLAGKGFSGASFQAKPTFTFFGFFLFGATFAMGWTPCVGPILSGILILAASDKTVFQGMSLLFFYALGLGLPLIVIATFCGKLPKDGLFWRVLRGKGWEVQVAGRTVLLHSTNLFSGLLLITLGTALVMGYLTYINSLIPIDVQIWFSDFEEVVLHLFM
ncbi:MAG: SUMF1/EgtB/PvdO family nonheme iron enzyme [Nitrospinaceae bacterium]